MTHSIPREALDHSIACQLVDADGIRWEVLNVTFDEGRAWVQARRYGSGPNAPAYYAGKGNGGPGPAQGRVVERIVAPGSLLIWILRDGRQVVARGGEGGVLSWEIEETAISPRTPDPRSTGR